MTARARNLLRQVRIERGMSITELAFRVGRSEASVSRYESGIVEPSLAVARRLAGVLEVSLDDLFPAVAEEAA